MVESKPFLHLDISVLGAGKEAFSMLEDCASQAAAPR